MATLRSALPDAKQASFIIRFTAATDLKPDEYILRLGSTKRCCVFDVLSYLYLIYALLPVTNTVTISCESVSHDYLIGHLGVDRLDAHKISLPGLERIYYYRYGGASWIGKEIGEARWVS